MQRQPVPPGPGRRAMRAPQAGFVLAVACVAASVALFLIVWATYQGAYDGSVAYLRSVEADVWVLQRSADNLVRGLSVLSPAQAGELRGLEGVESVGRLVMLPAAVESGGRRLTVSLVGYDEGVGTGRPPVVAAGRLPRGDGTLGDIELKRRAAARQGDGAPWQGRTSCGFRGRPQG